MRITDKEAIADKGKYIARKGTDNYFSRCTILNGETEDDFIEVYHLPDPELSSKKQAKIEEIKEYDVSNNVNWFYINGQGTWLSKNDRIALKSMILDSVEESITNIDLWFNLSGEVVKINLSCDTAITMLRQLELYAKQCYDVTASHIKAVEDCITIEDIEAIDITANYPEKLNFNVWM